MNQPGKMNDDAHMESFFHSLKSEYIHRKRFDTGEQLRQTLRTNFSVYNHARIHTSLSRMPPASFELAQT
ncbi:MAG: integrase core domain-containing protein [Burkholderiaceae bacterium]